jgi:hypothetical protein
LARDRYGLLSEAKKPTPKYYYTGGMEAEAAETSTGWFDAKPDGVSWKALGL